MDQSYFSFLFRLARKSKQFGLSKSEKSLATRNAAYGFHIFITLSSSFHGFITNQFNDVLPVCLLARLEESCTGIAQVKGCNPVQA